VPVARHCGRRLQIGAERGCIFESLIYARFANRPIESIKRSDIVRLLDDMQRSTAHTEPSPCSPSCRSSSIGTPAGAMIFSPIRRGMTRVKPQDYAPDWVLSDDEIRALWRATEAFPPALDYLVCFLLLTTPQTMFMRSKNQSRPRSAYGVEDALSLNFSPICAGASIASKPKQRPNSGDRMSDASSCKEHLLVLALNAERAADPKLTLPSLPKRRRPDGAATLSLVRREFQEVPDNYAKCRSGEDYLAGVKYRLGDNPNRPTLPDNLKEFESRPDELRSKFRLPSRRYQTGSYRVNSHFRKRLRLNIGG
jgi:hypothetical protein